MRLSRSAVRFLFANALNYLASRFLFAKKLTCVFFVCIFPPTDGRKVELPVLRDAAGATFLDVRRLFPETGICTFDPGSSPPQHSHLISEDIGPRLPFLLRVFFSFFSRSLITRYDTIRRVQLHRELCQHYHLHRRRRRPPPVSRAGKNMMARTCTCGVFWGLEGGWVRLVRRGSHTLLLSH